MLCVVGVGWVCVGIPVYLFGGWMPWRPLQKVLGEDVSIGEEGRL